MEIKLFCSDDDLNTVADEAYRRGHILRLENHWKTHYYSVSGRFMRVPSTKKYEKFKTNVQT